MPLIDLWFATGSLPTEQAKKELCHKVTDFIVKEAKQPQHYVWVRLHEVPAEHWMVDRLTINELKAKVRAEREKAQ